MITTSKIKELKFPLLINGNFKRTPWFMDVQEEYKNLNTKTNVLGITSARKPILEEKLSDIHFLYINGKLNENQCFQEISLFATSPAELAVMSTVFATAVVEYRKTVKIEDDSEETEEFIKKIDEYQKKSGMRGCAL